MDWALFGVTVTVRCVMSNELLVALKSAGLLEATNVKPTPALLIVRPLNVATPSMAGTVTVPASVPPVGFAPMASVTSRVSVVTRLPPTSRTRTVTAGLMEFP